ncbi:MAG: TonB-dependent receptor [Gammaproteobacteria bacterium]|nr:TonB-dependent receptor [Gammaproteobacteria bacterium]
MLSALMVNAASADDSGDAERMLVLGRTGGTASLAAGSSSLLRLDPEDAPAPVQNIGQLLGRVPGLAVTGEGGLFQVYSVRGLSGQRVRTLIEDVPLWSERAAGNAASFIDPLLVGSVDVFRGPASTYLGSGAMGGGASLGLRQFRRDTAEFGYWTGSDERFGLLAGGGEDLSFAASLRVRNDGETPDGRRINDHFRQGNLSLKGKQAFDGGQWQYYFLAAEGRDIGRANNDFPTPRQVNQTEDQHYLGGARLILDSGDTFKLYAHPNSNDRDTLTVGKRINTVSASAHDAGAEWSHAFALGDVEGRGGLEYFTRRSVEVDECELDLRTRRRSCVDSLDGKSEQWAGLVDGSWHAGALSLDGGLRFTLETQNAGFGSDSDQAWTGFAGAVYEFNESWRANVHVGTGFRFPSLTEKGFSGTTARGGVVGNPDLESEHLLSTELGLTWLPSWGYVNAQVFREKIRDYIERVPLSGNIRTYRNLSDGVISGLELAGSWEMTPSWRLDWQGQHLRGEGDDGEDLAEIPADRVGMDIGYTAGDWDASLGVIHRFEKSDIAATERVLGAANLLEARVDWRAFPGWTFSLFGKNLGDSSYYNSADVAEVQAEERRIGLSLRYAMP